MDAAPSCMLRNKLPWSDGHLSPLTLVWKSDSHWAVSEAGPLQWDWLSRGIQVALKALSWLSQKWVVTKPGSRAAPFLPHVPVSPSPFHLEWKQHKALPRNPEGARICPCTPQPTEPGLKIFILQISHS